MPAVWLMMFNPLALFFPKLPADETTRYANQKGTVADIAKNFDYAVAFMTVTALNSEYGELTLENVNGGSSAEFESAQSITKFSFSYASVNSEGIVKLTMNFLQGEKLFLATEDRFYPTDRFRALAEGYFEDEKGRLTKLFGGQENA